MGKPESFQAVIEQMIIYFKKGKHQWKHKPHTLTCVRDDGSVTWTHLPRGIVQHDFAHYVIETTLGLKNAFLGLVAKGYDIPDFNQPKAKRPFEIPKAAIDVEPIVALLQADMLDCATEGNGIFQNYSAGLPITLTEEQLDVMRQKLRQLLQWWEDLRPGESMTLQFKV